MSILSLIIKMPYFISILRSFTSLIPIMHQMCMRYSTTIIRGLREVSDEIITFSTSLTDT